jgi:Protein of unknown function (DUF2934)
MPSTKTTAADKPAAAPRKRATAAKPRTRTRRRQPTHEQISERAYFISLEEGNGDEFGNWLRAERELAAA